MDASCKIQGSIHVFRLVNNMCPGKWVHISLTKLFFLSRYTWLTVLLAFAVFNATVLPDTFTVSAANT